jgi:hypothetical protein
MTQINGFACWDSNAASDEHLQKNENLGERHELIAFFLPFSLRQFIPSRHRASCISLSTGTYPIEDDFVRLSLLVDANSGGVSDDDSRSFFVEPKPDECVEYDDNIANMIGKA